MPGATSVVKNTLFVGQPQLFQLLLAATGGTVSMTVVNDADQVVLSLTAGAGSVVSGPAVLLTPGRYRITYSGTPAAGSTVSYSVRGAILTDPIGPVKNDLTLAPRYMDLDDSTRFRYPGDPRGLTIEKYYWASIALAW
jgi:hypothetical protein